MLEDELVPICYLVDDLVLKYQSGYEHETNTLNGFSSALTMACKKIRVAWSTAAFSDTPDYSLKRYLHFHLEGIRELLDTLPFYECPLCIKDLVKGELIALIDYHLKYFNAYFNFDAVSPDAYTELQKERITPSLCRLKFWLEEIPLDASLNDCLFSYFDQMDLGEENAKFTFRSLFYFENLVGELETLCLKLPPFEINESISAKLLELNFNNLGFFCYRQQKIKLLLKHQSMETQLEILQRETAGLKLLPECSLGYDYRWPSLAVMLSGWLVKEILALENTILMEKEKAEKILQDKLPLNLSVAHLACLIKLFFDENLLNTSSLADVFRFMSRHYRTKRQETISVGSLSKEFYSTSQVTAAVVREMLLKMVARINRNFFPVWAVIYAVSGVWLRIR